MKPQITVGIFGLLLLFGAVSPALSQSALIADHVVINEVDINPPGDDSKTISEWIEIFNPTTQEIDIGGWKIASTTVLKKTLTIKEGTTIKPGQFLTFSYQSLWFTDLSERVELRDSTGNVIDQTPIISDLKNDFISWQRIYDGYDTDSSDDWKFVTSTAGSTNGKLVEQQAAQEISVTVSVDKPEYVFGETATISGTVSKQVFVEFPVFHQEPVIITITGPNYYNPITLYPNLSLVYQTTLKLQQVLGINEGVYKINVSYAGTKAETQFSVGETVIGLEEKEQGTLTITTDKESYLPGEWAKITAKTSEIIPFEGLKFTVTNPDGVKISQGTLYPNTSGEFSTSIFMDTVKPIFGEHTIVAQYSTQAALTTFSLAQDIKEAKVISLRTDKSVYGLGETVIISGRLNNLWIYSLDLEILQTGTKSLAGEKSDVLKILDAVRLAGDSTFKYELKIPNSFARLGEYRVTVSKEVGQATIFFKVVENPAEYVELTTDVFTVSTDKTIYNEGDQITIFGKIGQLRESSTFQTPSVKIQITRSDGGTILSGALKPTGNKPTSVSYSLTAFPDIGGNYKIVDTLYKTVFDEGTYNLKASYADGKFTSATSFTIVDPLNIGSRALLQLNKQVFGLGEEVVLEGIIPGLAQGSGVQITLIKPDGDTDKFGKLADNSRFSWKWTTPVAEKKNIVTNERVSTSSNFGVYRLVVGTNTYSNTLFFKVSSDPANDTLNVEPLTVTTEKAVYKAGETLQVTGTALKRQQGQEGLVVEERAQIIVKTTTFPIKEIYNAFVYLDNGGNFKSSFNLPVTIFKEGDYKVTAFYQTKRAETLFRIDNEFNLGGEVPLVVLLDTDQDEYRLGDTVAISGRPSKLVSLQNLQITVIHEDKLKITCGTFVCGKPEKSSPLVVSPSGSFTHQYKIPMKTDAKGKYEVIVDAEFGKFATSFTVIDIQKAVEVEIEKEQEMLGKRTTEKVNRLPDTFVPISVENKMEDGTELKPRIIQGTLLTPSRGEEANVNLKISTQDGLCIIGQEEDCLVQDSTRAPGTIYQIVEIEGTNYKVRYSGPDARVEKFTILPEASEDVLPESTWNVEVIKDIQPSRLYYRITYISLR